MHILKKQGELRYLRYIFTWSQRDWLSVFEISSYFKIIWDCHVVFIFVHICHNLHNLIYLENKVIFKLKYVVFTENSQWSSEVHHVLVNGLRAYTHGNDVGGLYSGCGTGAESLRHLTKMIQSKNCITARRLTLSPVSSFTVRHTHT